MEKQGQKVQNPKLEESQDLEKGEVSRASGTIRSSSVQSREMVDEGLEGFESQKKEYVKTLLEIIDTVFHKHADVNVQKVGLIYLAKTLRYYPQLCERYLEVLLAIHNDIMMTILSTDEVDVESYIVLSITNFLTFRHYIV